MKKTILIIDDNEKNRKLARIILQNRGFDTIEADTGTKGLDLAYESQPDLILMDIQLPGIDGFEATKILKNKPETQNIPIIALTSYAMVGDRERIIAAGCNDYVAKPVNKTLLIETISQYL